MNRLARRLGERGLIDHEREAHAQERPRNAIRSHEHFDALCARRASWSTERRYYNVVFKAVVEDLLLRLYEQRRARGKAPAAASHARTSPRERAATAVGRAPPGPSCARPWPRRSPGS